MNDSLNEYHLTKHFEYRREQLMDEARRERLKAEVLRRAHQQSQVSRWLQAATEKLAALHAGTALQRAGTLDQPCVLDDCLESSPT